MARVDTRLVELRTLLEGLSLGGRHNNPLCLWVGQSRFGDDATLADAWGVALGFSLLWGWIVLDVLAILLRSTVNGR